MKKGTIILLVVLVVILGLFYFGKSDGTASLPVDSQIASGSVLSADETEYDFGVVAMNGGVVQTSFTVSNDTGEDIRLDSVVTSCMCTTAYIVRGDDRVGPFGMPGHGETVPRANEIIGAGEDRTIEVIFDPAAHGPAGAGEIERSVYLVDENGGALELGIRAEVTL